jgi:rare lipoprotein A
MKPGAMKKLKISLVLLGFALTLFPACIPRVRYFPGKGNVQTGLASWYGPDFHGKPTSNREIYNMNDMTAAHKTLPFGTKVMVTNLDNGRAAVVRINDRGPFVGGRIIDLSYAAARILDMVGPGVVPVRVEILKQKLRGRPVPLYAVQVGSFISRANALDLERKLRPNYGGVYVTTYQTADQVYYRVRVRAKDRAAVQEISESLSADGYPVLILEEDELFFPRE